ncbi:MAG: SDR family NAD(P)-dependent oxidoreductase [Pseudomonadota bacterium]
MSATWLILGASSAMARAFARRAAAEGVELILAGRDGDDLSRAAQDCKLRGATAVATVAFDLGRPTSFAKVLDLARATRGQLNVACFVGSMPEQVEIDAAPALIDRVLAENLAGPLHLLQALAEEMAGREGGTLLCLGSVAGDRGRRGNYVYGAAKAGLHAALSGLRSRYAGDGVHVMTVKPGFVDTAMTWGVDGMFLVASPAAVAEAIWKGAERQRNVLYVPWFWAVIMGIIRLIPERIFKRLPI